ncbi:hypothetical protein [Marinomonas posidonica]|uniref:Uncharacterized protein n=1 Tax=Marinomonas posidonica (strain CECT 7376 / NCIMB 14433 / IVIA-Po-181) TaxID=491952 RepID=F6CSJ2_MARPP|nr:hypothetical protein [Marinomonas posidonica]AEF56150.1 hypothetical protein Mar181_3125 [Marinomonas posidonica IVIA-Po-181]
MLKFYVHMTDPNLFGKSILVFLRPILYSTDYRLSAWQELVISDSACEEFVFDPTVSAQIQVSGKQKKSIISSAEVPMFVGQLCDAITPDGLSPQLQLQSKASARQRLTPSQYGVRNSTCPRRPVSCNWLVSGSQVVTMPHMDFGMTATFEYDPAFYFSVIAPISKGQNYTVQSFTDMTYYSFNSCISAVDVYVEMRDYKWEFRFEEREPDINYYL